MCCPGDEITVFRKVKQEPYFPPGHTRHEQNPVIREFPLHRWKQTPAILTLAPTLHGSPGLTAAPLCSPERIPEPWACTLRLSVHCLLRYFMCCAFLGSNLQSTPLSVELRPSVPCSLAGSDLSGLYCDRAVWVQIFLYMSPFQFLFSTQDSIHSVKAFFSRCHSTPAAPNLPQQLLLRAPLTVMRTDLWSISLHRELVWKEKSVKE